MSFHPSPAERSELTGKRVLVLGGAGFIGSHLSKALLNSGVAKIVVVDSFFLGSEDNFSGLGLKDERLVIHRLDAVDFSALSNLVISERLDIVFNLAVIPLPTSLIAPSWTISANVQVTVNCCELAKSGLVARLIHFSSSEVYGSASYVPMDETHPKNDSTPYAASKIASDAVVFSYVKTYGIDALVIRPFNNFGPNQNSGSYSGVIPRLAKASVTGGEFEIYGDGLQTRDYIFVSETVRFALDLASVPNQFAGPINIATGRETSVIQLVEMFEQVTGASIRLKFGAARLGDVRRHCGSTQQLATILGSSPQPITLEQLALTVEWYKSTSLG